MSSTLRLNRLNTSRRSRVFGLIVLLANAIPFTGREPREWKVFERQYNVRSHQNKQRILAAYGSALLDKLAGEGKRAYTNGVPEEITPHLDLLKQLGFYVDVVDGKFISPREFGTENVDWATWLMDVAEERLRSFEKLHGTEEASLQFVQRAALLVQTLVGAHDEEEVGKRLQSFVANERSKKGRAPDGSDGAPE